MQLLKPVAVRETRRFDECAGCGGDGENRKERKDTSSLPSGLCPRYRGGFRALSRTRYSPTARGP